MEYKLTKLNHTIDASNPALLSKYLDENTLLTKLKTQIINSSDPEKTIEELQIKHPDLQIFRKETEEGVRLQISRVIEYRPRRSSSVGNKPFPTRKKNKKHKPLIHNKNNPFGRFMMKEFKKDKISGNFTNQFKGFGPKSGRKLKKNKSTSRLGAMRRYKEQKKLQGSHFKVTNVPSKFNEDVKVLPHEELVGQPKSYFKRF